jgi:hypothetical protein
MLASSTTFILATAAFVKLFAFAAGASTPLNPVDYRGPPKDVEWKSIKYSVVEGYFKQDQPETDPSDFDYVYLTPDVAVVWRSTLLTIDLHSD